MIDKVGNERKWVDILNHLGVQCSVVLNKPEGPVLLLDEEDRCRYR
jgi:Trm5-related predicted tRNA methylase